MQQAFALHARADAELDQKIRGPVLDQPGANAIFDIVAAAVLDDDRRNALQVQQPRQHQPRGPRSDNPYLGAHYVVRARHDCLLGIAGSLSDQP